ncbi:amine dehydrogenase large subunit [Pollutimonas thiosulfatoxidans]|uniref:Amine dehydrogenase n=1 Tax=Pollutimonas thiosulfatoxidans TaxID=2028345 RepID=A0A410GFE7_9BURK|nr:amine dehydrogenase large subunit [Pollutimonas thiosulfatoxidans]MBF6615700.1 amine dehydrogenase [Candidimonas sp.]QAA95008.1 amine dehydrogenase [Pollutimonas thiosulfatoxidans]
MNILRKALPGLAACALMALVSPAGAQHLPVEQLTGGHHLPADASQRVYVMDSVFQHLTESRLSIFDGATGKFLGMIPTSYNGHMQVSKDGKNIYTMTTYHERVTRGKRTDVVEIWDASALTFKTEIIIPPKRAQALNYRGIFRQTTDGKFIVLQNATPATSITVVDIANEKFASEITATAGCWSVVPLPNKPRSFMTICGDGALLTIDLDEKGEVARQSRSKPMFSVQDDPIFIAPGLTKDKAYFVSFYGNVYAADISGDNVSLEPVWSLLNEEDKAQGWVPGGYNVIDIDRANKRMYVFMHPDGKEGSHKNPAAEIWVYDLETKKRVAREPGRDGLSMSVAQGPNPRLLTLDGGNVNVYDISAVQPKYLRTIEGAGEAALQVEPHPGTGGN